MKGMTEDHRELLAERNWMGGATDVQGAVGGKTGRAQVGIKETLEE